MKKALKLAPVLALTVLPGYATAEEATEIVDECEQSENCTVYTFDDDENRERLGGVVIPPEVRLRYRYLVPIRTNFYTHILRSEEDI